MEESGVTLAPVHGAYTAYTTVVAPPQVPCSTTHQVALQPETGEEEMICVVSTTAVADTTTSTESLPTPSSSTSQMDLGATQMLEQCVPSSTDSLLPKTTEEACTQTLPDQCPPYVDIRSPADSGSNRVDLAPGSQCATPQLTRSLVRGGSGGSSGGTAMGQCTPLLEGSPCITPGQCTPLLDHKTEHFSLGLPPVVICGGLGNAGLVSSEKSDTSSAVLPICRICHMPGELDDEQEMLISPCRCAGTLQFIHNTCLQKWLQISAKKSRKPPKCELCHYQYHRHKKFKFSHWRFPRVTRQDKILHLVFIINLVIMISCAVATVMCFLSDKGQITKFPRNKADLSTEEIITLSCGVLFFVSFFIAMSVQIRAKHTIYQLFVKFVMQNVEWEIDEYDKSKDTMFTTKESKPAFV